MAPMHPPFFYRYNQSGFPQSAGRALPRAERPGETR